MGHIYIISNKVNTKVYIGSTINLNKRWNEHKRDLLNNKHQNIHFQRFVNKYGIESLIFNSHEEIDDSMLLIREQYYLDTIPDKFNIAKNAQSPMKGLTHSDETRKILSIKNSGVNNKMFGTKRPQWLVDKLTTCNLGRIKGNGEKIKHVINLPNRIEVVIKKGDIIINCFSSSHAAKIIGVIIKAIKNNYNSKGWTVEKSNEIFYIKEIISNNLQLFDENCHPQPELIQMLKSL